MPASPAAETSCFVTAVRVTLEGLCDGESAAGQITGCAASLPGVVSVERDPAGACVRVHYDVRRGASALVRAALQDRLAALPSAPAKAAAAARVHVPELGLTATIAHEVPGRVRLRVEREKGSPRDLAERVAARLSSTRGVVSARPTAFGSSVVVSFERGLTSPAALLAALNGDLPEAPANGAGTPDTSRRELVKMAATAAVFGVALTGAAPLPLVLAGIAVTAIPSFVRAARSLLRLKMKVDVLDATAILVCILQGDPVSAGAITTLLAIGDVILDRTRDRARVAISKLIQLDDGEAWLLGEPDMPPRRIDPRELRAGDRIVVYPGTRIPADGVVTLGAVTADEMAITGESLPREKLCGDEVLAASVAVVGQAVIEVTRAGNDTTAARIVQILQGVGMKPMTLQENAERSADRLVLPTFGVACFAYALSGMMQRLVCVLITDFGTGVRISVPTTALASMTLAARRGLLVKGARSLERLTEIDTIVFDKTGTLTRGVPEVTHVVRLGTRSEEDIIALAAAAETNQSHPLADAIRRHAQATSAPELPAEHGSETYRIGLGLETRVAGRRVCVGNARLMAQVGIDAAPAAKACEALARQGVSSVLVAEDHDLVGVLGFADAPRDECGKVVEALRAGGRRRILLLSGDARAPVEAVARHCGIDEAVAEVLPHEKASIIESLRARGRKVAMVGDGINDAPALALADVGISLRGATAVARETADVVLLEGGLERLPQVFAMSEEAMARVRTGLSLVIVPNAVAIVLGAVGLLTPVAAAMVNNGSTIAAALYAASPLVLRRERR